MAFGVAAAGLFWLTLPPTIGQNLDCQYAPVSTVLPGGHQVEPEPVHVDAGESRILPILELRVCGDEQEVTLDGIEPLTVMGDGATLDGFWLLPGGTELDETGLGTLPSGAVAVPLGDRITADESRLLVARLVGTGGGDYILGSVRLHYHAGTADRAAGWGFVIVIGIWNSTGWHQGTVHLRDGDVYSVDEVRGWLTETGWRFVEHAPLVGPQCLIVAEAA